MSPAGDLHTLGHALVHHAESVIVVGAKHRWSHGTMNGSLPLSGKTMCDRHPHNDLTGTRGERSRICDKPGQPSCHPSRKTRSKARIHILATYHKPHLMSLSRTSSHVQTPLQTNQPNETTQGIAELQYHNVLITLGQSWICRPSRRSPSKKAHLVDLKPSDKCPDTFLCYSTAQTPTIPYNL